MQWESLGFKENPFNTDPIVESTLPLYTGHFDEVSACRDVASEKDILMIIEGSRGVGTTSFANYIRFSKQIEKLYFTPRNEIRVEPNWNIETLLGVIVANIVREIEFFQPGKITKDLRFQNAKALSTRIAETYRSFGIDAFGFGANYGKAAGITSQPVIVSSAVLGHHLEDLASLVQSLGYRYGLLLQLNNLDIGAIHEESHLKYLFNALRDYIQTENVSWFLVGDVGLRKFIAQEVDRLDDIVSFEIDILPISKAEYHELLQKRIAAYSISPKASSIIDEAVFSYLYDVTEGRLRYIFGLLQRLVAQLHLGDLTDRLTLDIAKPMISRLAHSRIARSKLSASEEVILRALVHSKKVTPSELARITNKSMNYVSNVLNKLLKMRLITSEKKGKSRYYHPELDANIAYGEDKKVLKTPKNKGSNE